MARPDKEVEAVAAAVNEKRKRKKTDVPLDDLCVSPLKTHQHVVDSSNSQPVPLSSESVFLTPSRFVTILTAIRTPQVLSELAPVG